MLHTGDLTHLSKPKEFDTVDQVMKIDQDRSGLSTSPASMTISSTMALSTSTVSARGTTGAGWHSFDYKGVHFIGLVNVANIANGKTALACSARSSSTGWKRTSRALADSTPIVVFAHVPLWTVYPQWGWGTEDSAQALGHLKRFGSVSVLNGHIHQILQKVEGNVTFHTARSTAFPQPEPGKAESPGPMKNIAADRLGACSA